MLRTYLEYGFSHLLLLSPDTRASTMSARRADVQGFVPVSASMLVSLLASRTEHAHLASSQPQALPCPPRPT